MAKYRKLSRTSSQRKALIRGQVTALIANGKIVTTEAKAKEIRKVAEGLIAAAVREKDNFDEVTVNGKVVNIPSYLVKAGDVVEIKESKKNIQRMKDIVEVAGGRIVPEWLDIDAEKLQGTVKELPSREQIDVPVNEMLIVELYSK